jgi:quercetin dioxygenase-like cupin family protein
MSIKSNLFPHNMASTTKPTSLPPCKRYILGHDDAGKSIILPSPEQVYHGREGTGGLSRSFAVSSVPAVLAGDADVKAYMEPDPKQSVTSHLATDIVVANQKGAAILVIDLAPGGESQMHQTVSIDFSICVQGLINMELDGGEMIHLKPGVSVEICFSRSVTDVLQDHVIQRGTMHKWYNASKTEPARFLGVTMPCEPFEIAGKMLEEVHVKGTGALKSDGSRL